MKIERKLDKWLWFILMLLPALITLFALIGSNGTITDGASHLTGSLELMGLNTNSIIAETIQNVGNFITPLTFNVGRLLNMYMCYIIYVQLAHVLVDVSLFVVKVGRELCERII